MTTVPSSSWGSLMMIATLLRLHEVNNQQVSPRYSSLPPSYRCLIYVCDVVCNAIDVFCTELHEIASMIDRCYRNNKIDLIAL